MPGRHVPPSSIAPLPAYTGVSLGQAVTNISTPHMEKDRWSLPPAFERNEERKDEVYESVEELETQAWQLHDNVRALRIAVARLFAAQADYGDAPH